MIHNRGSSSGQGSRHVRWLLQMMCLYTDANLPVSARKWPCKICHEESFNRRQELDRHIQNIHLPCWLYCPRCDWRGGRVDELREHQQRCGQVSTEEECHIYEVKTILDIIRDPESNNSVLNAQKWAVHFVKERATVLGKGEWLADPWGRPEQRERRERRMSRR
jgi:hypothetical protein